MHDGTHVVLFSLEQFLSKLATEFEDFLILLIKLVSDEVEVAETRPVDEGACDEDHTTASSCYHQVITDYMALIDTCHTYSDSAGTPNYA